MTITHIETFKVIVPLKPGLWNSPEFGPDVWDQRPIVIMKVHTDAGIVGLGELGKGKPEDAVHRDAPAFIGKSPLEFNLQELPCSGGTLDGFEMALYDIIGKAIGVPVYQLLGGKFHDRIPVAFCSGHRTPQDAADQARDAAEHGYRVYKVKASGSYANLPDRVRLIHETAGPNIAVRIDPNQKLSTPALAVSIADRLAGYNVECFESPVSQQNLDWYVLLRQKLHIPLALHLHHAQEVIAAVKREACDYINLGSPGMLGFQKGSTIAEAAGIPTWHGSGVGLAISDATFIHACAATKNATLPSDIVGTLLRQDDLVKESLQYEDGHVRVPEGPGLGVELDEEALERWGVK
ncbi:MAG: mandelate racemase/muconate lactonizing enzyme family protein [Candidatus Latescibacteria bacterium]|nr:mandelate racemase/muconate lactonizing enzyme family protein [Candidatus Latescibacterota bacterium]